MFIKKASEFDQNLVADFENILNGLYVKASCEDEEGNDPCEENESEDSNKSEDGDKLSQVVSLLSEACELIEDDDKYAKICKKINKIITKLGKMCDGEDCVKEITPSEDVEDVVQEEIEEQRKSASLKKKAAIFKKGQKVKISGKIGANITIKGQAVSNIKQLSEDQIDDCKLKFMKVYRKSAFHKFIEGQVSDLLENFKININLKSLSTEIISNNNYILISVMFDVVGNCINDNMPSKNFIIDDSTHYNIVTNKGSTYNNTIDPVILLITDSRVEPFVENNQESSAPLKPNNLPESAMQKENTMPLNEKTVEAYLNKAFMKYAKKAPYKDEDEDEDNEQDKKPKERICDMCGGSKYICERPCNWCNPI